MPLVELSERHDELPRDRRLAFICAPGVRSALALKGNRHARPHRRQRQGRPRVPGSGRPARRHRTRSARLEPRRPGPTDAPTPRPARHHQIVVVGGGSGGITAAAQLCRKLDDPDVAVVEPREHHEYQPLWTLVGAGVVAKEKSRKPERAVMPAKATWGCRHGVRPGPEPDRAAKRRSRGV